MKLGVFSVSLTVKNLQKSKEFYQKLDFEIAGGGEEHNYLIMRNGDNVIGLFQGMFDKNALTFNPGWDAQCNELADFDDVRSIEKILQERGLELVSKTQAGTTGPASITLLDPDGNPILIDQHR